MYSTVQCTVQFSVQYSSVYSTVQCKVQFSVQYNSVYSSVQSTVQFSVQYSSVYSTLQLGHCTVQYTVHYSLDIAQFSIQGHCCNSQTGITCKHIVNYEWNKLVYIYVVSMSIETTGK